MNAAGEATLAMMTLGVATATTGVLAVAAVSTAVESIPAALLWLAAILGALGVIYKALHLDTARVRLMRLAELAEVQADFLLDWNGSPARPGVDAVPSMPERVEKVSKDVHEVKSALPSAFDELMRQITDVKADVGDVKELAEKTDERVTEHRRRGEEQAVLLRAEVERRADDLQAQLHARNEIIDARLDKIDVRREQLDAYRSALHELGMPPNNTEEPA